ncbi:response regulator [Streptomyces sp. BA2]|uniref:response regulator n=1 Tax=Streptomyces sp. BA2 TaxID=436595 RepID=UPI0013210138|nr:response regulator [Streptomyces sp. BA2]
MTSVLIVDDQHLIRTGVAAILRTSPDFSAVTEAADGEEAVAMAAEHRPDVILMDIRLPGCSGIDAAERILALSLTPQPRIIILTTFDVDEYVYAALRVGASGFLLKHSSPERLLAAISLIASGDILFDPSVTRRLIEAYVPRHCGPRPQAAVLQQLTAREVEVLRLVGRGLTNDEIAVALVVSEATVKSHLHRAMTKLALRSRAQAVVLAYEAGLMGQLPRRTGEVGEVEAVG